MRGLFIYLLLFFGFASHSQEMPEMLQVLFDIEPDIAELVKERGGNINDIVAEFEKNYFENKELLQKVLDYENRIEEVEKIVIELQKKGSDSALVIGNNCEAAPNNWECLKSKVREGSTSAFNKEYTEKEIATIALTRDKLPEFLKTTKGKKADLVTWLFENTKELDNY